jgi:Excalibur calcium-binding domain.
MRAIGAVVAILVATGAGAVEHEGRNQGPVAPKGDLILAQSCKQVRSCEDAVRLWCNGYSAADRDGDGIPCENVCKSEAQVEKAKKKINCNKA